MLPDRVSNPGPLTYESGALPIALRGPACSLNAILDLHYLQIQQLSEIQMRGGIEDNSKIIFLLSQQKHML